MMTKFFKLLAALILAFAAPVFSGCDMPDDNEMYSIEIIGIDGSFHGYYKVDGDDMVFFKKEDAVLMDGGFYYLKKNLGSFTSLRVYAYGYDETSSLNVYINRDDDIVDEGTSSRTVSSYGNITCASVTLTYEAEDDDDD